MVPFKVLWHSNQFTQLLGNHWGRIRRSDDSSRPIKNLRSMTCTSRARKRFLLENDLLLYFKVTELQNVMSCIMVHFYQLAQNMRFKYHTVLSNNTWVEIVGCSDAEYLYQHWNTLISNYWMGSYEFFCGKFRYTKNPHAEYLSSCYPSL
jgi:hypothetical protein